jgi:hypothetical protein
MEDPHLAPMWHAKWHGDARYIVHAFMPATRCFSCAHSLPSCSATRTACTTADPLVENPTRSRARARSRRQRRRFFMMVQSSESPLESCMQPFSLHPLASRSSPRKRIITFQQDSLILAILALFSERETQNITTNTHTMTMTLYIQ